MRVIKQNNVKYVPFSKSLPSVKRQYNGNKLNYIISEEQKENNNPENSEIILLKDLKSFFSSISNCAVIDEVNELLRQSIKMHLDFIEADFFIFDVNNNSLAATCSKTTSNTNQFINNAYKEGILEWAFSTRAPKSIPLYNAYYVKESNNSYLIIPLFENSKPKGIFSILHNSTLTSEDPVSNYIHILAEYAFQKINYLLKSQEVKTAYNSLQAYQSKLSNDYKLYAVGELAGGVIEQILEPLQVILSSVDLLKTKENDEIVTSIKRQVKKIETSTERLRRFSARNTSQSIKILPCDLNRLIENYFTIFSSSMEKKQIECILDLENGLPSVLSHPDYLNQLLVNVFNLITSNMKKSGGILVQTKLIQDTVTLRFITTELVPSVNEETRQPEPNYKIISQLVAKHEGEVKIDSSSSTGSTLEIKFPLKRKILQ